MKKTARDMPDFLDQNRPKSVKRIYSALKRDHPDMPAEMKARIAARQGKKGKQRQGPPYKGPIKKWKEKKSSDLKHALQKRASDLRNDIVNRAAHCGESLEKTAAQQYFHDIRKPAVDREMLGSKFCKLAHGIGKDPWDLALEVADNFPAYAILSKTASSPQARELAEFYLDWSDEMEKSALLPFSAAAKMTKAVKSLAPSATKTVTKTVVKKPRLGFGKGLIGGAALGVGGTLAAQSMAKQKTSPMGYRY